MSKDNSQRMGQFTKTMLVFIAIFSIGVVGIVCYSKNDKGGLMPNLIGNSLLFAGGAFFIGVLLGFLFGIPRTLQHDAMTNTVKNESEKDVENGISYKVNTNLEQISDWLTKIIVGVGLTQLVKLPIYIKKLGSYLSPVFGNDNKGGIYGVALIGYYLVTGFLFGYLVTRIFMGRIFRFADESALARKLNHLEKESELNGAAIDLADKLLSPASAKSEYNEKEIIDIFSKASSLCLSVIFNKAESIRSQYRREKRSHFLERVAPVFKALMSVEPENHKNYAQLAYVLKDKNNPNYDEAEKLLTKAIEIRGDYRKFGFTLYELNRAICKVHKDEKFGNNIESDPPLKDSVVKDLTALKNEVGSEFLDYLKDDPKIKEWIELNKVDTLMTIV